jgi:hypothetical protein
VCAGDRGGSGAYGAFSNEAAADGEAGGASQGAQRPANRPKWDHDVEERMRL